MKTNKSLSAIAFLIAIFAFGAFSVSAQTVPASEVPKKDVKVGGYKKVEKGDADAKAAADLAVTKKDEELPNSSLKLLKVKKAERQIVAGTNYRMCLHVAENTGTGKDRRFNVTAVVFRGLDNMYELKSWEESASCKFKEQ